MKVIFGEIISVGTELLTGGRTETNSIFLAEMLANKGIQVRWKSIVGDVEKDIGFLLRQARKRADVVILTGGLGATIDDRTREVVATTMGRPLRKRKKALNLVKSRYATQGRKLTETLLKQAQIPSGADILENPVGSALGFLVQDGRGLVIALPGVSREARAMFIEQVSPKLDKYLQQTHTLERHLFQTYGLTESEVNRRIKPAIPVSQTITFGLLTSPLGVEVSLSHWLPLNTKSSDSLKSRISHDLEKAVTLVRHYLGKSVYAEGNQGMEEVVGKSLMSQGLTLSIAESCTGGLIGHRLTQVSGASTYFDRSLVCYSNKAKEELLDVSPDLIRRFGAVSSSVARAMAQGVRKKSRTSLGLAITGIAGPGGGTKQKPVGLVFFAIDGPKGSKVQKVNFHGDREYIKMRASQAALNFLRKTMGSLLP